MKDLAQVRIESPGFSGTAVEVFELQGRESISKLFEFEVQLVCHQDRALDEDAVLAAPAELVFDRGGIDARRVFGVVSAVTDTLHSETLHRAYTLSFRPRAWCLGLNDASEAFLDKSVPEVITEKLTRVGLEQGDDFELRLLATYAPREFIVQYKETDLAFLSRLAEHVGICFFFEHGDGTDKLVFSDANSGLKPIAGDAQIRFEPRGEHVGVYELDAVTRRLPARVVVKDYNSWGIGLAEGVRVSAMRSPEHRTGAPRSAPSRA
jgi:uncharacterized protein involved in type VI secretion and phage assembly